MIIITGSSTFAQCLDLDTTYSLFMYKYATVDGIVGETFALRSVVEPLASISMGVRCSTWSLSTDSRILVLCRTTIVSIAYSTIGLII